jgi:hypothetical protein
MRLTGLVLLGARRSAVCLHWEILPIAKGEFIITARNFFNRYHILS